jgi:surface antigen
LALLVLVACAACSWLPVADADGHRLGPGPAKTAYPWAGAGAPLLDPWGFVSRQCTSYAAWYLNAHGVPFGLLTRGPGGPGLFTSAGGWDDAAEAAGFPVRATPIVGSIAQWDPGEASPSGPGSPRAGEVAGGHGHVAVVQEVNPDGSVLVSEYDGEDRSYDVHVTRAPRYLYIGVPAPAPAAGS